MPETRPWWKVRPISVALTVFLSVLIISGLLLVLYGGQLGEALANALRAGRVLSFVWQALQIPFALVFVMIALVVIYRFVPNAAAKRHGKGLHESDYRRRWFSPDIVIGLLLWLLVSLGFRLYLHFFRFLQRHLWLAGRADHSDVVVLPHRRADSSRRRNQLRV